MLIAAISVFVVALIGMIFTWPKGHVKHSDLLAGQKLAYATVTTNEGVCGFSDNQIDPSNAPKCLSIKITSGAHKGTVASIEEPFQARHLRLKKGDHIVVVYGASPNTSSFYSFYDYNRNVSIFVLFLVFATFIILLGRWQGVRALLGIGISFLFIVVYILPAILKGHSPVEVAFVGAVVVLYANMYLAHGFRMRTTTALLGTLFSLLVIALLSALYVHVTNVTGLSSEEASFISTVNSNIDLRDLLLAGFVIGALGVLTDVTVTQVSAVWEIQKSSPKKWRELYKSGMQVGRDHIASTVNTLVFAYAGAALPLLLLFVQSSQPASSVLTSEVVAIELLRTFIGGIGLVAAVPVTTALAAFVAQGEHLDTDTVT